MPMTKTIESTLDINKIQDEIKNLMSIHGVSLKTGFLAEDPLRNLPKTENKELTEYFLKLDQISYS